ncbi:MAG: outer membrane protein assembly factor BamC, partial [Pseudomonadales bacterium]
LIRSLIRAAKEQDGFLRGRDRLLIRVEPGLREETSEIYVRHENDELGRPSNGVIDLLTVQSLIPAVEVDALSQIGGYIAAKVSEQTISMVAQEMTAQVKSSLERDVQGTPVLELRVDYDRAWAVVGQALDRAEVEVDNLDRVEGFYYVHVPYSVFTGVKKGWLGRLLSRGKDGYDLQLRVKEADKDVYHVDVLDTEAVPVDRDFGQQVLSMLRDFAS